MQDVQRRKVLHSHTYRAFFNGGTSKHQAQINQNEAWVMFFNFWIVKLQLHFIGSVKRKGTLDYPQSHLKYTGN